MNFSVGAFLAPASSTSSRIFATADSLNSLVVLTESTPFLFMNPDSTPDPGSTSLGTASPVSAEVSTADIPSSTTPSRGIRSPGFTSIISPTLTSAGETLLSPPGVFILAYSGLISIRSAMDFLDRFTARSCKNSPALKNSITATASGYSLIAKAPSVDMLINRFSPKALPLIRFLPAAASILPPTKRYPAAYNMILKSLGSRSKRAAANRMPPAKRTAASLVPALPPVPVLSSLPVNIFTVTPGSISLTMPETSFIICP